MSDTKTSSYPIDGEILIVDDNPMNIKLLANMLTDHKYQVRITTSGARALAAVAAEQPELIMLDINMPGMDGYEVCARLKADETTRNIPVIFISALDEVMDKVKAFNVGGVDYVTKPFQIEEVLARIESQLSIHRLRRELEEKNQMLVKKNEELIQSQAELVRTYLQANVIFSAFSDTLPGSLLDDRYVLQEKVGEGGFGIIYKAWHQSLDRAVAIKIFKPTASCFTKEELEKIRQEGISAARVDHPNACSVYDFCISKFGVPYLVMELLQGEALNQLLHREKFLSPARCLEIILPVCDVLEYAHNAGIVHRDIKPSNIFLHKGKNGVAVKLLDFGIAKMMEGSAGLREISKSLSGTPAYVAPERWGQMPYDGKADIYSLGIMLYRMLCGKLPFNSGDTMMDHLLSSPIPLREQNPKISREWEAIVLSALAKNPLVRPSAAEMASRLKSAQQ